MRILHVVECFGGGVATYVIQLCNLLTKEHMDVHLAFSIRAETPKNYAVLVDNSVSLHPISLTREITFIKDVFGFFQILILMLQIKPDIIHLHSSKAGFLGRFAAIFYYFFKGEGKVFYSPHGFSFLQTHVNKFKQRLYLFLERLAYKFGGVIIACSKSEAEEASRNIGAQRVLVVDNAVDTKLIPESKPDRRYVNVCTVGRICPQKNPEMFAKIANYFSQIENVRFTWIGGGDLESEKLLKDTKNIRITGWLEHRDVLKELKNKDIYLQTSLWEGMPIALIEAMVAGIPAVVTDVVGNRDVVIHGTTGYIVKSEDEFLNYLKTLISDEQLRNKMSRNARTYALKYFSLERFKSDIINAYTTVSMKQ